MQLCMMKIKNVLGCLAIMIAVACGKSDGKGPENPDPPQPPETKTVLKPGDRIKVMSYNIHHANPPSKPNVIDIAAIAAVINRERPDIVALQEVDVRTQRSGTTLDQAATIGSLTGMQAYFSKSMDYQGGEYGNAILSKYPIIDRSRHALPATDGAEPRSLAVISIGTEGGGKVYFGSTHLDVSNAETRNMQVDVIRAANTNLNMSFVIGGDFNAQIGSEPINRFVAGGMFRVACIGGCPNTIPVASPNRAIDFVFLNQQAQADFTVISYVAVNETYASDHRPVLTELQYK